MRVGADSTRWAAVAAQEIGVTPDVQTQTQHETAHCFNFTDWDGYLNGDLE
jgi:hypothetical protein